MAIINQLFGYLDTFNTLLWGYVGITMIIVIGVYLSFKARWMQVLKFPVVIRHFKNCVGNSSCDEEMRGADPVKVFFASLGGCIGIGNLVGISFVIQIGGPGALVWIWITALFGMILKYAEIYLGIKYRVPNNAGGYDGGPMYFLRKAFPKAEWIALLMAFLLCIYGIEIFMFNVVKETLVSNFQLSPLWVTLGLLALTLICVNGGVSRIANINSALVPFFVLVYLLMTLYVVCMNGANISGLLTTIFKSAFTSHAAIGGFAGATLMLTIAKGMSGAAYSGDIGIGYASIIHSETRTQDPTKQAAFAIFGIFLDTFVVCTCTVMLILVTGVWHHSAEPMRLVQLALEQYFPYMNIFMPFFLFMLGFSTILPYMIAGLKCAKFLSPTRGPKLYYLYAILAFLIFSFFEVYYALIIMQIAGGLLMVINIAGIFKLRHEIDFNFSVGKQKGSLK